MTTPKEKFETRKLPMMPIRDVVIFPYMMTPFVVGRESSVRALEEALAADKKIFLAYFEKGCPPSQIRGARLWSAYRAQWFDPRTGTWSDAGGGRLDSNEIGIVKVPPFPSGADWGLRLTYVEPAGARPR